MIDLHYAVCLSNDVSLENDFALFDHIDLKFIELMCTTVEASEIICFACF